MQKIGKYLQDKIQQKLGEKIANMRGRGLMIGIELNKAFLDLPKIALKHKILINIVNNNTIRLLPYLIITEQEVDELVKRLEKAINEFYSQDAW